MPIKLRYCVPNFNEMENHYEIPSSRFSKPKISLPGEEDVMELMLQNGQVVVQKSSKKSSLIGGRGEPVIPADKTAVKEIRPNTDEQQQLFIQEDEMASWLQYPFDDCFDRDMYTDLLYSAPPLPSITTAAPPIPQTPEISPRAQNFVHFSRLPIRPRIEPIPQPSGMKASELTVVESNVTPAVRLESRVSQTVADSMTQLNVETGTSSAAGELARKRTTTETDDTECQSQDIEFEAVEAKKHRPGSSSTKRSRAAEVHNLSERRRRDRINEKMKALQDLIPRCNKSDKASMLDEAIEYLKSLQMQVQMMSMGYGIMPMMYPGMHQYMPAMGMGMNRPMVPYPSIMASSAIPNPAAGPRFLAFHMPPVGLPDPSRNHAFNQSDPMNKNQQRMPNIFDPYQQFHGLHQSQIPLPNNQAIVEPGAKNRRTSKNIGNPKHQQTG